MIYCSESEVDVSGKLIIGIPARKIRREIPVDGISDVTNDAQQTAGLWTVRIMGALLKKSRVLHS